MIPAEFHFVWLGSELPARYEENLANWRRFNPRLHINLWIDSRLVEDRALNGLGEFAERNRIALKDICGDTELSSEIYEKESGLARRAAGTERDANWGTASDIARVNLLIKHGGVYCDTDIFCKGRLAWIAFDKYMLLHYVGKVVCNDIIGAAAGNDVMVEFQRLQQERLSALYRDEARLKIYMENKTGKDHDRFKMTMKLTGPVVFMEAIRNSHEEMMEQEHLYQFPLENILAGYDASWM